MMDRKVRTILGVSAFYHDSTAAIIHNGRVIALCEEERFNLQKHTNALPSEAVKYCLQKAGIAAADVDELVFYFNPWICLGQYLLKNNPLSLLYDFKRWQQGRFFFEAVWLANFWKDMSSIKRRLGCKNARLTYMPHTMCHVWYGIYSMPEESGVVLSNDSMGEYTGVYAAKIDSVLTKGIRSHIKYRKLFRHPDPHSIGYLYGAFTKLLGFRTGHHEGKVMALASFEKNGAGEEMYNYLKKYIKIKADGQFRFRNGLVLERGYGHFSQRLGKKILQVLNYNPILDRPDSEKSFSICYALQKLTNDLIAHQIQGIIKLTNAKCIVHVGGVAQNSVANGFIARKFPHIRIHVPPVPHDAGCALGAAIKKYHDIYNELPVRDETAFLGPASDDGEIISRLSKYGIKYELLDASAAIERLISLLASGKTVAIHDEGMECGPRALGHRTILADPSFEWMKDHLNNNVKYREWYRPYGAIISEDHVRNVMKIDCDVIDADYMSFVYDVKDEWKKRIPSLIHIDGTCRTQVIRKAHQPFIYNLLYGFNALKSVPVLINTSLNVRSQPICRSIEDSISAVFTSQLDGILFNQKILVMKDQI